MTSGGTTQESSRRALKEMQRYLADEIAPFMAAESFEVVLHLPPAIAASAIEHWLEGQLSAPDRAASVSGYLYHAVKKLHVLSELDLLDRRTVERYLEALSRLLVSSCPEHERAELRRKLGRLGEVETTLSAPIELLNREKASEEVEEALGQTRDPPKPKGGPRETRTARQGSSDSPITKRRLNMFLRRLHEVRAAPKDKRNPRTSQEALAHLLSRAAVEARDASQLDEFLRRIPDSGVVPRLDRTMFRLLGDGLPGWEVDREGAPVDAALGHLLQAMHRIVALAGSREEGIERFGEMVYAAIEKLNEGHLAQAVAMLDVADRLTAEGKIDAPTAKAVRERAQGSISLGPVRQFASTPAKHGLLRKVLRFFPDFSPEYLLQRLDGEPRRETRKLMLALLEVHGPPCRPKIVERLHSYLSGKLPDPRGFFSRNAVFLIRRIPRGPEQDLAREIEILTEMSRPGRPFLVAREAIGALGPLGLRHAEQALLDCLDGLERDALGVRPAYTPAQSAELLDRACAALAHVGTPAALRRVIRHAFRDEPGLGGTLGRLEHLSGCDLSVDPDQLLELLDGLRRMLPSKVMGIVVGARRPEPLHVVRALSGTPVPLVERLFEDIAARFPGRDFAREAQAALARMRTKSEPEATRSEGILGDLDVFGLPTLFQSLADAESTGRLVIFEHNGSERGTVFLLSGKILGCEVGRLRGLDAVCQLFERPRQGAFRFERVTADQLPQAADEPLEVLATVFEAIRRHDELQGDSALVPDGTSLATTATPPELPPHEEDRELIRMVWREASSGTAPESCEGRVAADAYRVRRLYAHWLDQGALQLRRAA